MINDRIILMIVSADIKREFFSWKYQAAGVVAYVQHLNQLHEPLIVYLLRLLCLQAYKYDWDGKEKAENGKGKIIYSSVWAFESRWWYFPVYDLIAQASFRWWMRLRLETLEPLSLRTWADWEEITFPCTIKLFRLYCRKER